MRQPNDFKSKRDAHSVNVIEMILSDDLEKLRSSQI